MALSEIRQFSSIPEFGEFVSQLEPKIGLLGGRFFEHNGASYRFNEVVKLFATCIKSSDDKSIDKTIFRKIRQLDQAAFDQLNKSNVLIRLITFVRQFFGNLFYNRVKVLAELEFPGKTPVTSRGEYRLLILDGDGGPVACRVRDICLSTFPHFSENGTIEFSLRSFLRMRNLTAVRGDVPGTRMVGPGDYYGNVEKPDQHLYTIDIDDIGAPVILRAASTEKPKETFPKTYTLSAKDIQTTVKAKWMANSCPDIQEVHKKYERPDRPVVGKNIFPKGGILEISDTPEIKLKRFDARQVDLSPFKARLVDNTVPFQLTSEKLPSADEFRAVSYLFEPNYASKETSCGGGVTLETHSFSQTMTPLDDSSGGFVTLGKWADDSHTKLDIIAVEIPFGHTLIVDQQSIHGDATLSGRYMMLMTSNHKTMQTADCVYLKNTATRENVAMTIEGESPLTPGTGSTSPLPIAAYKVHDPKEKVQSYHAAIAETRVIKNMLKYSLVS